MWICDVTYMFFFIVFFFFSDEQGTAFEKLLFKSHWSPGACPTVLDVGYCRLYRFYDILASWSKNQQGLSQQ